MFCQRLSNFRKENSWFGKSRLKRFVPKDNTYVYFQYDDDHLVMCVYNGNTKEQIIDLTRFEECLKGHSKAKNILTGELLEITKSLIAPPKSVAIFEFLDY